MHSPWVVGANAALLNVTAIVSLQSTRELSPGLCVPSSLGTNPKETFRSHPTSWWLLSTSVREGWSLLSSSHFLGALIGSGAYKEAARVSPGLGQCAGAVWQLRQEVGQLIFQRLPG